MSHKRKGKLPPIVTLGDPTPIDLPTAPQDATAGLRVICQWCRASIPATLELLPPKPLPTTQIIDLANLRPLQTAANKATHRIYGWCPLCNVWGADHYADLSREPIKL